MTSVNESLPVKLTTQDVENNPEFVKLLTALAQHLNGRGIGRTTEGDLTEAQQNLQHEKGRWLQQHILYLELQELLMDYQIHQTTGTPSKGNMQFYKALKECVRFAEIGDYLHCSPNPDCELTLLGLKQEDIDRHNPHRKLMQSLQQRLIPEVEARLRKKCESLVSFHDAASLAPGDTDSSRLTFAKASQLPAVLEAEKQSLEEQERSLKGDKSQREKQFWQYYQALMESLQILEKLITNHRLKSQKESDGITSKWLASRCDAMCLKIKLLEMQLLCDTYYADTVQSLHTVKQELNAAVERTSKEVTQVSQALKAYEAVGQGFDSLVQDYTHLRDEIDNKKWALRELKTNLEADANS